LLKIPLTPSSITQTCNLHLHLNTFHLATGQNALTEQPVNHAKPIYVYSI